MFEKTLALYDEIVNLCPDFERKGKSVPYTSANGHMFSLINKEGQLGFRYSKEVQEKYIAEWESDYLMSHGSMMKGYVMITEKMMEDLDLLSTYLNESYNYVMSLPKK
jgi:hypothetical protein